MYEIWSLGHKPFEAYRNAEVSGLTEHVAGFAHPVSLKQYLMWTHSS